MVTQGLFISLTGYMCLFVCLFAGVTGLLALDMDCDRLFNMWLLDMQADGRFKEFVKIDNTVDGGYMARVSITWCMYTHTLFPL